MSQKEYHVGDKVRIYYPAGIVKGEVIGVNEGAVEDGDKFFYTTKLYLVVSEGEKMQIVTPAFMSLIKTL